jgi:hypothetical protein
MWIYYNLTLHVNRLAGGIPKHPDLVKSWQEAKWPTGKVANDLAAEGITPETAADKTLEELGDNALSEEEIDKVWTGFAMDGDKIVLENRNIKAMFKESANIVKDMPAFKVAKKGKDGKVTKVAIALRSKLAERVFPQPVWIPIMDDIHPELPGEIQSVERPIHVVTRQGPRTALKRVDIVNRARLVCQLKVLDDNVITEQILRGILEHASENGVGTDRSQGCGTFTYELTKREES